MVEVLRCPMNSQLEKKYIQFSTTHITTEKFRARGSYFYQIMSAVYENWSETTRLPKRTVTTPPIIPWQNYCREMFLLRRRFVKIFRLSPKIIFIPDCQYIMGNTLHASVCGFSFYFFFRVFTIAYMNKFSFMMSGRACICGSAELCSFIPVYKDFFFEKENRIIQCTNDLMTYTFVIHWVSNTFSTLFYTTSIVTETAGMKQQWQKLTFSAAFKTLISFT